MGGVGLLVLLSVLLAGGNRAAVTVWADPGSIDWDVSMSDPARACPGKTTANNGNTLIEAGECPDVTSTFWLQGAPAGTQSFFDRANAIWYTSPLGGDATGDGILDATDGLVANRPTRLGASVGQVHLEVQTNMVVAALPQNNIDDVAAAVDSTVTGQPLTCGAANTLLLQDDIELWNATTDDSHTVSASQTQTPDPTYPPGCGTPGLACAPKGVTMMPIGIMALEPAIGLPHESLVSRSYGIAKLPIVNGIESHMDVNFLVYRLHDVGMGIDGYLGLTLVQYPGLRLPDPTVKGYSPLAQTVQTCPPFEASVTVRGVTSDPDFNEDGVPDLSVTPELNRLVVCPGGACGPYDYDLAVSLAADYDGDTIPGYLDRCDTDPTSGNATEDTDGDTLTGTCDTNGGSNPVVGGWNARWPWDAGQDVDGDGYLNYVDNCPTVADGDLDGDTVSDHQRDSDGDGVGDVCDPEPTIPGNGEGYPDPFPGVFADYDDLCNDPWTVGASEGTGEPRHYPERYCLKADGVATNWNDSNDNGVPDYLDLTALSRGVTVDCNSDSDSDGLVDAIEAAPPNVQPCAPTITKYGQGTDPLDPDTDGDSHLDGSDNCPLVASAGQENTDGDGPPFGDGVGIGNGTGIPGNDATVPNGDSLGDACDADMDNDGLPNASDPHPGGDITYDTNGNGNPCVPLGTDGADAGPSWDSNCNGVRDGVEASCPLTVNPNGDDDGDGLLNTWEVCKWGTDPTKVDSDSDGKGDCIEAASTDGNTLVDFGGDGLNSARATLLPAGLGPGKFGKDGDFDLNGNNVIMGDFGKDTLTVVKIAFKILPCK